VAGGRVERRFEAVRDAFVAGHPPETGGAQLCVYRNGAAVVDIWTGRDVVNDRPYDEDTLTVLMSCTKGAVAILIQGPYRLRRSGIGLRCGLCL